MQAALTTRSDVRAMNAALHFAQSYSEARDKFLAAGEARSARRFRHVHPAERGAQGEELSIDLAQIGDDRAPGLLLLTSGTHGVEGFCGSGCQVALLHDDAFLAAVERSGVSVLMLHALNPYGFSHLRRSNEDNADLNRNFVDFSAPLATSPAYAEIHPLLLPAAWPPPQDSEAKLGAWSRTHGEKAFQAAVSGGQYAFPDGMFYGGSRPWWGNEVTSFFDGSSTSARVSGVISAAAYTDCPRTKMTGMALEYGTYSLAHTLRALRAEHWVHNHPEAPARQREEIKRALRDSFYIDADDW